VFQIGEGDVAVRFVFRQAGDVLENVLEAFSKGSKRSFQLKARFGGKKVDEGVELSLSAMREVEHELEIFVVTSTSCPRKEFLQLVEFILKPTNTQRWKIKSLRKELGKFWKLGAIGFRRTVNWYCRF